MSVIRSSAPRFLIYVLVLLLSGCAYPPRRLLSVNTPPEVLEGDRTRITLTVTNVLSTPIIPVSVTLYARQSPAEYFAVRHIVADINYLQPLHAAEVRHLKTLRRIEADHVRDGRAWRRIPHSRFLHPHIIQPGKSFTQDFEFQAYATYRRLLYVDFFYLRLDSARVAESLYATGEPLPRPPEAERFTQVFHRIAPDQIASLGSNPERYLLHRPHLPDAHSPRLISKAVRLPVRRRPFSYRDAARRARYGARTHGYFAPAGAWVFDYDVGTWFVSPTGTTKLKGHYVDLLADLQAAAADSLIVAAPRVAGDRFLDYLQKAGYSDPKAATPTAQAAIPAKDLVTVLQQAESLGYTLDRHTWRAVPATP